VTRITAAQIVLAGGRSRRLNGIAKAGLIMGGRTLLDHAVTAGDDCCHQVVVGPPGAVMSPGVVLVREDPPFGGPVAGIDAGLAELDRRGCAAGWVLVTACDHPAAEHAVAALIAVTETRVDLDGVELVAPADSDGQVQNLFALYRREALRRELTRIGGGRDLSVRRLVTGLATHSPVLPDMLLDDIDDAVAAARWGITVPSGTNGP
jgi:molybdopterin-guanine dinucleotide biosynthesis protein A